MTYPCHANVDDLAALARRTLKDLRKERAIETNPTLLREIDSEITRVEHAIDVLMG